MHLTASDFITYQRPKPCDLRVLLKHWGKKEEQPGPFEKVLHVLGLRHEREHLATLGPHTDLGVLPTDERVRKTAEAVANRTGTLYQASFSVKTTLAGIGVEIMGVPDFLILDGGGYLIRDSKMSRRIDQKNHPEILLQVQLYGWLFEKSCGTAPKALQVHGGTGAITAVPYDGGVSALRELERILAIKQLAGEPYEPVGWTKCMGCGFIEPCWKKAESDCDVSLVSGIGENLARTLHVQGITSRKELLARFNVVDLGDLAYPHGKGERRVGRAAERILQSAEAMELRKEIVLSAPDIPVSANYVMLDFEGMPPQLDELDKIYLWGAQVYGKSPSEFMAAVSEFGPDGDRKGWLDFLTNAKRIFDTYGDIRFVHWAPYEKRYLNRYIKRYGDVDGIANRVRERLLDLLNVTKDSVVLPLPSSSLKVVEDYVGFERKEAEYGGQWAMAKFIEATETSDEGERKALMDKILAYNKEDLEATWAVFEWLRTRTPAQSVAEGCPPG